MVDFHLLHFRISTPKYSDDLALLSKELIKNFRHKAR